MTWVDDVASICRQFISLGIGERIVVEYTGNWVEVVSFLVGDLS